MKIVNVVATAKVKERFDLKSLLRGIPEAEFPRNKAPWLMMRLQPENYYIAFYKSGKILVTGIRNPELIDGVVERVLGRLKQGGIETHLESITIHNIVLIDKMPLRTTLENIARSLQDARISYEPEQFPALIYKDDDGISYTLFSNGKMIIAGVTDILLAQRNIERFKTLATA